MTAAVDDDTPWLDAAEQRAWRAFIETVFAMNAALDADLASTGLTLGDYQVLVALSEAPDHACRMCDLAVRLQLSPSGLTRRIDGLVRRGDVARVPSPHDRRVMLAVLTDAGEQHLREAAPVHVRSVRARLLDHVARADLPAWTRVFENVHAALHAEERATA